MNVVPSEPARAVSPAGIFHSTIRSNNSPWLPRTVIFLTLLATLALATKAGASETASVTLAWNPSPDETVAGYRLYYGVNPEQYTNSIAVGNTTSCTVTGLVLGVTYYFATTAYDAGGMESDFSNEVSYTVPKPQLEIASYDGQQVVLTVAAAGGKNFIVEATEDLITWIEIGTTTPEIGGVAMFVDEEAGNFSQRFYRLR